MSALVRPPRLFALMVCNSKKSAPYCLTLYTASDCSTHPALPLGSSRATYLVTTSPWFCRIECSTSPSLSCPSRFMTNFLQSETLPLTLKTKRNWSTGPSPVLQRYSPFVISPELFSSFFMKRWTFLIDVQPASSSPDWASTLTYSSTAPSSLRSLPLIPPITPVCLCFNFFIFLVRRNKSCRTNSATPSILIIMSKTPMRPSFVSPMRTASSSTIMPPSSASSSNRLNLQRSELKKVKKMLHWEVIARELSSSLMYGRAREYTVILSRLTSIPTVICSFDLGAMKTRIPDNERRRIFSSTSKYHISGV
mmetsp:Transcript_1000/g.1682  ORF Transcript_1000/g.1682 Transcript_1000/m.1682 type:complete len:309 (-) Transcript_1000:3269-4195(-)